MNTNTIQTYKLNPNAKEFSPKLNFDSNNNNSNSFSFNYVPSTQQSPEMYHLTEFYSHDYLSEEDEEENGQEFKQSEVLSLFFDFDDQYFLAALEFNNWDLEQTLKYLMEITDWTYAEKNWDENQSSTLEQQQTNSATETPAKNSVPVCKYFLLGDCKISNCPFKHTTNVVCRFYLQGFCSRGDSCLYLHQLEPIQAVLEDKSKVDTLKPSSSPPSIEEFPVLVSSKPLTEKKTTQTKSFPTLTMADQIQLADLTREFNWIDPQKIKELFQISSGQIEVVREHLIKNFSPLKENRTQSLPSKSRLTKYINEESKSKPPEVWQPTGPSLNNLYSKYRTEAEEHAKLRNAYFQRATAAYISGDRAAAKELSQKGREHDQKMKELHNAAQTSIFETRNKNLPSNTIDLHGLHPQEALDHLETFIKKKKQEIAFSKQINNYIYIITGTGHHSYFGKSKLLPTVEEYLKKNNYFYIDSSSDKRGGMLKVKINRN